MKESDPIDFQLSRRFHGLDKTGGAGRSKDVTYVSFDRRELDLILRLYGLHVASGDWRDYAIDMKRERAVFSVFRHSCGVPLYRIEKDPKLARRQGAYSVVAASGHIL